MTHSFNPNPVAEAIRLILLAFVFTIALLIFRESIKNIVHLIYFAVWGIALIKIAHLYVTARFHVVTLDKSTITYTKGILSQKKVILPYPRITETTFDQSLIQRLFNVGNLRIDSAGGTHIAIHVDNVQKKEVDKILEMINKKKGA